MREDLSERLGLSEARVQVQPSAISSLEREGGSNEFLYLHAIFKVVWEWGHILRTVHTFERPLSVCAQYMEDPRLSGQFHLHNLCYLVT